MRVWFEMETIDLLSGTKWDIIEQLSARKQSPLELAQQLNTTIANISQQLRLLEAAGLVKTEKTRSAEKGKPRILYSISRDFVFIVSLQKDGLSSKKLIDASMHHNIVSRIWQIKNADAHFEIEKAILQLEDELKNNEIDAIAFDEITNTLHFSGKKVGIKTKIPIKFSSVSNIEKEKMFMIYKRGGVV